MRDEAPPVPIGPPTSTPSVLMTPHHSKSSTHARLTPSKLDLASESKTESSVLLKTYRTTSTFIHNSTGDINPAGQQLEKIVDAIDQACDELIDPKRGKELTSVSFEPKGCTWVLQFHPSLSVGNYALQVVCRMTQPNEEGESTYVVNTTLENFSKIDIPNGSAFAKAKSCFDGVHLEIRKAVVRCEFPEFNEGCKGRPFREVYQLNVRLKSGSFATVCRGTHRATGHKVAIKCVLRKDLPPSDDANIFDEVAILASLRHPHVCPLLDFFDEKDCYFLVMELMAGGDLFDRIGKKSSYTESDARDLCLKLLQAMAYCHDKKIAHCDMKPKNLLLVNEDSDNDIKLADFGFAARVYEPKSLTKQCGTPFFVAPEILIKEKYDQKSDMWSVGCIIFLLLGGNLPFAGRSQKELFRSIVAGKYEFSDAGGWNDVSEDAKDLISKLLVTKADDRLSARAALQHPWILAHEQALQKQLSGASSRLKQYNARMKLRSAMIAVDWVSSISRRTGWGTSKRNLGGKRGGGAMSALTAAANKMSLKKNIEGDEE